MATVKFSEVNSFIKNLFSRTDAGSLENSHSGRTRSWFIANMSKIGRYAFRDFERFGNLKPSNTLQGRQDGWVSLTEEVPDPHHTTYGTGILYIHGELELPEGKPIRDDCFSHTAPIGNSVDFLADQFASEVTGAFDSPFYDMEDLSIEEDPDDDEIKAGFYWEFSIEEPQYFGRIPYAQLYESVSGIKNETRQNRSGAGGSYNVHGGYRGSLPPSGTKTTPSVFNDDEVYAVSNERNNYPMLIINSAAPESIDRLLTNHINGKNGMYDGRLPSLVTKSISFSSSGGRPREQLGVASGGMKVSSAGRKMILDHISPLISGPGG